jgi:hypothetical protein
MPEKNKKITKNQNLYQFGEIPFRNLKKKVENIEKAHYLYESFKKSSIQSHKIYGIIIF